MRIFAISLIILISSLVFSSDEKYIVNHYQTDKRYKFGLELLKLALHKVNNEYTLKGRKGINEARGQHMLLNGSLDIQFLSTTSEREKLLKSIKIPIYRGLLGLRLLLVTKDRNTTINVNTLKQLQNYTAVHGTHWGDLPVYRYNNLKVLTNVNYPTLFELLKLNRADYFHRGISEIWGEIEQHKSSLMIKEDVMLFYPHPVYFFVSNKRPQLYLDLKKGLDIAIRDGSFRRLFIKTYSGIIKKANMKNRSLIILKNPVLPKGTPKIETGWWLPKKFSN